MLAQVTRSSPESSLPLSQNMETLAKETLVWRHCLRYRGSYLATQLLPTGRPRLTTMSLSFISGLGFYLLVASICLIYCLPCSEDILDLLGDSLWFMPFCISRSKSFTLITHCCSRPEQAGYYCKQNGSFLDVCLLSSHYFCSFGTSVQLASCCCT